MKFGNRVSQIYRDVTEGRKLHVILIGGLGILVIGVLVEVISYWLIRPVEVAAVNDAGAVPRQAATSQGEPPPTQFATSQAAGPPALAPSTFCNQVNYATANPELDGMYTEARELNLPGRSFEERRRARTLYTDAAMRGHRASQHNLGVMLRDGEGGAIDVDSAIHWFRRAADQNDYLAIVSLAAIYSGNDGRSPPQFGKALEYYLLASRCDQGNISNNIGVVYAIGGAGVERDLGKAAAWFRKAEVQGSRYAAQNLKIIADGFEPPREKVWWDQLGPLRD